ncbi:MAG TPA: hypothetical protein VFF36_02950 [Planctomycetota bacterium]|nr:hypothetical protein [Planctomycetota bacterium]
MTDPLAHGPLDAGADQAAGPDLHHLVVGGISRSWRWIVLLTALGAAIGLAIGVAQPNQYVSEAKLLLRVGAREMASSESMIGVREESSSSAPTMYDEIQMLSDVAVFEKVVHTLGPQQVLQPADPSAADGPDTPYVIRAMHALQGGYFAALPNDHDCPGPTCAKCLERATKKLMKNTLPLASEEGSNVIVVRSVSTSPESAQHTVQALVDGFIERHRQQFSIQALVEKIRPKVEAAKRERDAAALAYLENINRTGVGESEPQSPTYLAELNVLEDKLWDARLQLQQLQAERQSLVDRVQEPSPGPVTLYGPVLMIPNGQYESLLEQKLALVGERQGAPPPSAARAREIDGRIVELDQQLARTPRTVAKATESRRIIDSGSGPPVAAGLHDDEHTLELKIKALSDRYEEKKAKSNDARRRNLLAEQQRKDLAATRDIADSRYAQMQERFSTLEALGAIDINDDANLRVLQAPTLEPEKLGPQRAGLLLKGLIAGLLAGIAVAIVRQKLDTRLRYPELFERQEGLAVLGVVPKLPSLRALPESSGGGAR